MSGPLSITFVLPGPIARTGGYIYDCRMMDGLRARGWVVERVVLEGRYPFPDDAARQDAARAFEEIPSGRIALVDGLALGAIPEIVERHAPRIRIAAMVHLPLAADPTRDRADAARLAESERRSLKAASLVIATGTATVAMLAEYDLPSERIVVVEPGTDRAPLARGSGGSGPIQLLCVATVNGGKDHVGLVRAVAGVRDRAWHLTCAGSLTRDPAYADALRRVIEELELAQRVSLVGELDGDALAAAYDRADLFVLATVRETYGMAVAEALAHGLPVVSTRTGAIPQLVGDDAGIVVPPGDIDALRRALATVIGDDRLRARLAHGARRVRERLPTWEQAADRLSAALREVAARG